MLRIALVRVLAMVVFFAASWLMPLSAFAAIIPVCDGDAISGWSQPFRAGDQSDATQAQDCSATASASDDVDSQAAAMCDARAATVVAPNRIHPMSDARIDAPASCDGIHHGPLATAPSPDQAPDGLSWINTDHAILTELLVVRPGLFIELPSTFVVKGSPRAGFDREVYHPPRA